MNCGNWEERIALYAGGEADAVEAAAVELHLGDCPACRQWMDGLRTSMEALSELHRQPVAEAHFAAVRARVLEQIGGEGRPWWRHAWVYGCVALAAAAVVAIVITRPAPKVEQAVAVVKESVPPAPVLMEAPPKPAVATQSRRVAKLHLPVTVATSEIPRLSIPPEPQSAAAPEPMVVKLLTDDPDVVIYWIADGTGDRQ
jgi:anti-sigma factor RsiW